MTKNVETIIIAPGATMDSLAEVSCPWLSIDDHLRATQPTMRRQERSELAAAGAAMPKHVADSLNADAEMAFLDAAEIAAHCYERALAKAGRLSQPGQAHSAHLLGLNDGGNPARGIVFAGILCVPFWVTAALVVHRLL